MAILRTFIHEDGAAEMGRGLLLELSDTNLVGNGIRLYQSSEQEPASASFRWRLGLRRVALQQHGAAAVGPGRARRRRQAPGLAAVLDHVTAITLLLTMPLFPLPPALAEPAVVVPLLDLHGTRERAGQRVQPLVEDP